MVTTRAKSGLVLVGFLAACYAVAAIGALATMQEIGGWYASLNKPAFNPPNWLFGPVWTLLYGLMAVAAWLVWKAPEGRARTWGLVLFWIQLLLNFAWTPLFFHWHQLFGALFVILLLDCSVGAMLATFLLSRRLAAALVAPYLAWILFASVLNGALWSLNSH